MSRSLLLLPLLFVAPGLGSGRTGVPAQRVVVSEGVRVNYPVADAPGSPESAPPAGYHRVKLNGHTFTLPDGFTIELAAGSDLAPRPIVAAFDEKGRLYVCDSSGSNEKVTEQVVKKPHRVVRLEDANGDGQFDKSTVFVPNVMFPEGAMWLNGSLYVSAPPQIWKFTDTNDDGTADKQEVWFDGKTLTGCANDLHGPYLGPDGWVYWCKGAFAKQEYTLPNGKKFATRASHIFRARPDGTGIEPVMTGGMDNPVDVVFTPSGERIFSTTFLQRPADGRRDGLIHAVYGGVYGKDHDVVYEHPWTSPQLMPVLTHLGPAAPCGLHRYESDQFGKEYVNNVFACQFNLRKVSRHVLVPAGSTFVTEDSDFVVSDNLDFHPTDVIEDADGSLLIVDTGGWYKLCCPTSQLVKPDVPGAIYRVKRTGAHKVDDPRGLKIDWSKAKPEELAKLLGDPRPAVWWRAINELATRGDLSGLFTELLQPGKHTPREQLGAVWALARVDADWSQVIVRRLLGDPNPDPTVHQAAIHVCGLRRDTGATPELRLSLHLGSPAVCRTAAEALGRIGDSKAISSILEVLAVEKNDRVLDHSLTYALIEIGDPKTTAAGLASKSPRVRRACLTALDAMPNGKLDAKAVLAELDAKDPALKETAWWVAGKHPDWGDHLAGYFREQLKAADRLTPEARDELSARLAKFAKNEAVQKVLGEALEAVRSTDAARLILRAMARSGVKALPESWVGGLRRACSVPDLPWIQDATAVLRVAPPTVEQFERIWAGYRDAAGRLPPTIEVRELSLLLLSAAPPVLLKNEVTGMSELVKHLDRDGSPTARAAVIDILTRTPLTPEQLVAVASALKTVGPLDLPKVLPAFARSTDEKVGLALVDALSDPKVLLMIRVEMVKPILDKYPKPVRDAAEKLYARLAEARRDETARLERLLKELPTGDVRRGQLVFNGQKAQCAACHKIGYVGGLVGPDLTRIGNVRTERDLLESIVFPSASFVQTYESVRVTTTDGRTLTGILKRDTPDEIVLVIAADKEDRIARAEVESIVPGTVSVMPAGLDQQLTPQELADLVAFLKASK